MLAARQESGNWHKASFPAAMKFGRFWSKEDVNRQTRPAASVANDLNGHTCHVSNSAAIKGAATSNGQPYWS
jgi:hypothetical protein